MRLLTFASGGWVLLLTGLLTLALVVWAVAPAMMRSVYHPPGDGKTIDSYQFDLNNLQIPRDEILPVMIHRDMVPVMFNPTSTGPGEFTHGLGSPEIRDSPWEAMQKRNDPQYAKYLVGSDRVIGVEINGQSRCYPVSVMTVHEIVNDSLGDPAVPIAVTYNWPCDSAMVFDRRIDGTTVEFGVSGLIYNSNLLMYDVHRETVQGKSQPRIGGESLFSQLLAQGVSGPLAGASLKVISCSLTTWHEWSESHPKTTVLNCDLSIAKRYKDAVPTLYFQDALPFRTVKPRPLPAGASQQKDVNLPAKTRVVVIQSGDDPGNRHVIPISILDGLADKDGVWATTIDGTPWRIRLDRKTLNVTALPEPPDAGMTVAHSFWYAWQAMHPEDSVIVR